jgi:prepilin-type N-terminal cleavage/methylation domain-containing protein
VISSPRKAGIVSHAAFSLIEMVAVIAILVTLMTAGVSLLNGTGAESRKAATDTLTGLIEQARTNAITSRSYIILAIAEPADLPNSDERCRIGMFKIKEWPKDATDLKGELISRWQSLNTGIVLLGNDKNSKDSKDILVNPMDQSKINITYGGTKNLHVSVHVVGFDSRGGLHYPDGSTPIMIRIAEGGYRNGTATANKRAGASGVPESRLKIGRITARPYRIDG